MVSGTKRMEQRKNACQHVFEHLFKIRNIGKNVISCMYSRYEISYLRSIK